MIVEGVLRGDLQHRAVRRLGRALLRDQHRSVEGHLGFDALFQFSPFYFIDRDLGVAVGQGVRLRPVQRPLPRHPRRHRRPGTSRAPAASRCSSGTSTSTSRTPGATRRTPSCRPIAVMPILAAELGKDENWTASLPPTNQLLVSLRSRSTRTADAGAAPRWARCKVTQRAVPLDITLDKFGSQKPDDANLFGVAVTGDRARRGGPRSASRSPRRSSRTSTTPRSCPRPAFEPEDAGARAGRGRSAGRATSCMAKRVGPLRGDHHRRRVQAAPVAVTARSVAALFAHFLGGNSGRPSRALAGTREAARTCSTRRSRSPHGVRRRRCQANNPAFSRRSPDVSASAARRCAQAHPGPALAGDPSCWPRQIHVIPQRRGGALHERRPRHLLVPALAAPRPRQPDHRRRPRPDGAHSRDHGGRRSTIRRPALDGGPDAPATVTRDVELYGPGDIIGIDPRAIVQHRAARLDHRTSSRTTCPTSSSTTRTSRGATRPRLPTDAHRLRPWLALVVLEGGRVRRAATSQGQPLPSSSVTAPTAGFPPADQLWAWAHVHVNARPARRGRRRVRRTDGGGRATRLEAGARREPGPRVLADRLPAAAGAETRRTTPSSCPASRAAGWPGSGSTPAPHADVATQSAWGDYTEPARAGRATPTTTAGTSAPATVGDFEYLVRLLKPRPPDRAVGRRDMDVQRPGLRSRRHRRSPRCDGVLRLGGALRVPDERARPTSRRPRRDASRTGTTPYPHPFQTRPRRLRQPGRRLRSRRRRPTRTR